MADKYINSTGLLAIKQWIEGKFALDSDLDALDAKVDGIIAEGGEPNVIETVKVNGTALTPDTQKAVNVTVPTATSDLTNDSNFAVDASYVHTDNNFTTTEKTKLGGIEAGAEANVIETVKVDGIALTPDAQKAVDIDLAGALAVYPAFEYDTDYIGLTNGDQSISFTKNADNTVTLESSAMTPAPSPLATVAYVSANGGKIQKIKVNGTEQTIDTSDKSVNITVPTKVSDITNDSNFQTDTQVDSKIASAVASAVTLKGSVATYSALPSTGQKHGDMYDVLDTGRNYVWLVENGTGRWDDYAGTMDLSAYWTSTTGQTNTLEAMTVAEVNAILEPSA